MHIETNGVSIHVRTAGKGDTALVFLHYWGGSSRTWQHVTAALGDRFATVATDHRGWGESTAGNGDFSIRALAADAQGVIDALGLERYVLVGHSMGGKAAQLMASHRPAGLQGLVLVAPASPAPSAWPLEQRTFMTHAYDTRESVIGTCEHVLAAKTLAAADLDQVVEDSLRGTSEARAAWPLQAIMEDITEEVANIAVPVLVIGGELDKVDPVEGLKNDVLGCLPTATLEVLPGTGHLSPLESPQELASLIAGFVATL